MINVCILKSIMFAVILQTYEGAFAQGPGLEAHGIELSIL